MSAISDVGSDPNLHVRLESELPGRLRLGRGNALLVHGWCFHGERRIRHLRVGVGGAEHPLMAHGMPRADVYRGVYRELDRNGLSYWSGFWGIVPFSPSDAGEVELSLTATLDGGGRSSRAIGRLSLETANGDQVVSGTATGRGRIAICMATREPPIELFERQIASIREQTHRDWNCVISDDASSSASYDRMLAAIGDDERFSVQRNPSRLGVHANFERTIELAPPEAELIALADQDDRWHPDKLEVLAAALEGGAQLAYSDMRVTGADGELISPTYWTTRPNNHTDLGELVMTNTVTGAASLFRRSLLEFALPFPPATEDSLHDHWLAMVALATGDIAYVDRPLQDYVQHGDAALGHRRAISGRPEFDQEPGEGTIADRPPDARGRLAALRARMRGPRIRHRLRERVMRLREDYRVLLRVTMSATLLCLRCADQMSRRKRRVVERMSRLGGSAPGMAWLGWRALRARRGQSSTLGVERLLGGGILWARLLGAIRALRLRLPPRRQGLALALRLPLAVDPAVADRLEQMIAPLRLEVDGAAPRRVNLLIPHIDLGHFFGGYIAKLNLARRLAEEGLRVRIVCVDEPFYLPADWRQQVERFEGLDGLFEKVEIEFANDRSRPLAVGPEDRFIATTWWTAHIAHRAATELGRERFVYLVQEAEHLTYPMGSWAALARQTYDFPHLALFSTEFLRDYFRHHRLGVFASSGDAGDADSVAFQNAITPVGPPPAAEMAAVPKRLLFYARPEDHAQRNMFELGLMALAAVHAEGHLDGWEVRGIGAQQPQRIRHEGLAMEILPRQDQAAYAELLRTHRAGLSLMCTPHPSLVPLEMASAGMCVVTNTFENKTRDSLAAISENLIAVEPTVQGISAGLIEALAASGDDERRARGAAVNWSRSWDEAFGPQVIDPVKRFIERS